jgi:predicted aspartyl protease
VARAVHVDRRSTIRSPSQVIRLRMSIRPLVMLLLVGCTPPEPQPTPNRPPALAAQPASLDAFLAAQGYQAVPLRRLATGHFAVDGTAGAQTLTLIVDTGASHTILDRVRAGRFDVVVRQGRGRATGVGAGDQQVAVGVLRRIEIGPLRLDSLEVSVLDLANINQVLRQLRVDPVDGILGADMLLRKRAILDYGAPRLYLRSE